jgi:CubicO group peptidase (beta-lactamase class C family)
MKYDQQGRDLPFSARQPLPGQLGYRQLGSHQLRRGGRRFVIGTRQLVTTSLLLLLLFTVWRTTSLLMYHHTPQSSFTTQVTFNPQNAVLAAQVDHLLTNMVTHQQFSGSVLIAHSDQVILSKGYGMADWEKQVPNTLHTKFYLGSTTKQFTAMAILILQQENKLHVHDHLCSYITPCPPAWQPVTIHELLTHTSGIPELDDANVLNASPQSWINRFDGVPLVFAPGSEFSYCNVCYQILGYVVEQVAREP